MKQTLRIAIAQLNFLVGDIEGNTNKVISYSKQARDKLLADIIIFPELAITGYPPEDLLFRQGLHLRVKAAIKKLKQEIKNIYVLVGYPDLVKKQCYNAAALIYNKKIIANYHKQKLPNYGVFDEKRYFSAADQPSVINIHGVNTAITICEDLWHPEPMTQAAQDGAQLMLSINSSPFDMHKPFIREQIISKRAKEGKMPIVYVNCVGGQDELVFDGGSMVLNARGAIIQHLDFFKETLEIAEFKIGTKLKPTTHKTLKITHSEQHIYDALVMGVRDYIEKNHFPGAIIGLSGGIDSALTLAIAVDAIGKERVQAVLMPSRYTSEISITDAVAEAKSLGVKYSNISIEPLFKSCLKSLTKEFTGLKPDTTEENLQARCRGMLLMAISNKKGSIVLSTGNKSEMAVGYSTLYGDMVGGFCVLKDVPKTWVYKLAKYRNKISPAIPQRVITRPPSAELAADQLDQDSLPPYDVLDAILERYIEKDESYEKIVAAGFKPTVVKKILHMINRNEYKRRQSPPGVRITMRAFGRDRRYPITSGYGRSLD